MNLNKVVGKIIKSGSGFMVLQFPAEPIGQARVAPHAGSHGPILPLNIAGGNVFRVRTPGNAVLFNPDALGGRVAVFLLGFAIDFLQDGIIDIATKGPLNRFKVGFMAVCCQLDSVPQPAGQIVNKVFRRFSVAASQGPARNELCIGVNSNPQLNIARIRMLFCNLFRAVFFFAVDPCPQFVKLQATALEILENLILVSRAHIANFNQQPHYGFLRNAGHSDGGPDRASFDQAVNHLCCCVAG
jgi:hypothetical protein